MATLPTLGPFQNASEVRPHPSPGVTRLQRYDEPVRIPTRPGQSRAGVRLGHAPTAGVSRVASDRLCRHAVAITPVGPQARMLSLPKTCDGGLPHPFAGSAPTLPLSRPARRSRMLRPACSQNRPRRSFPSKASAVSLPPLPLRLLPAGATPYRVGIAPTEDRRLCTAHKGDSVDYGWCGLSLEGEGGGLAVFVGRPSGLRLGSRAEAPGGFQHPDRVAVRPAPAKTFSQGSATW